MAVNLSVRLRWRAARRWRFRSLHRAPACVTIALLVLTATALPSAGAKPLFGANTHADHRPPLDDDVHAAAAASAAKWQERVNRMFGSVAVDGRLMGRASALFGTAVPGISHLLLADAADNASGATAQQRRRPAALPCLHDDGSVAGGTVADCRSKSLGKSLDPATGGKAALLAHHMYQQRDEEAVADAEPVLGAQQQEQQQQRRQQQQHQQQPHGAGSAVRTGLGHGSMPHGSLAVAEAGLVASGPRLVAAARAASDMQPLAVHSRIVDRALDDHLEYLEGVTTLPLPVADGPDSTLRGWEAADEGGALGIGFQHLPAAQAHPDQSAATGGWWLGMLLRLTLAAACAALVAGLYVIRHRVASQRLQVGARYGDAKRLPLLSTPLAAAAAKGDDGMQPGTPDSASCRPRRLEADLDLASPMVASPLGSPRFGIANRSLASGKPGSGRQFHLQAFAGGLAIMPPQSPFVNPLGSLATTCSLTDPSPLPLGSPLSLASPSPSPQQSPGKSPGWEAPLKHVRWDAPSPEWPVLSPGPRSFRG